MSRQTDGGKQMLTKNQLVEAQITAMSSDGNGIAKVDGMVIFVYSGVTDNLTVRCEQHLYIASQEAMRKEDFLHGRTFESSNSPRAGVKANNDIFKAQCAERIFYGRKSKGDCSTYNYRTVWY